MKRYLVLENGEVFAGLAFGAPCDTVGELVFTTGMNGYIETLTDPSYCGQIVLQTFPLIGNYGIIPADFEGKCCVRGYVVREQCQTPSNFRCEETLDAFLKANNIPGIAGIDTRAVTRILREAGTMNAAICDTVPDDLAPLRAYRITDPVPQVTMPEPYTLQPEDFGFARCEKADLVGGSPAENAAITKAILSGQEKGHKRNAVLLNAGAALYLDGKAETMAEGVKLAARLIDSGAAMQTLEKLIEVSNRPEADA